MMIMTPAMRMSHTKLPTNHIFCQVSNAAYVVLNNVTSVLIVKSGMFATPALEIANYVESISHNLNRHCKLLTRMELIIALMLCTRATCCES